MNLMTEILRREKMFSPGEMKKKKGFVEVVLK